MLSKKKEIVIGTIMGVLCIICFIIGCTCSRPQPTPQKVSIVRGYHDKFPMISLDSDFVYSKIYDACYTYGDFSMVVADGDPFVASYYDFEEPDEDMNRIKKRQYMEKFASSNAEMIIEETDTYSAKTPEIDTLSAISMSADMLQSGTGESKKSMIIYDSGLSTTSLLDFSTLNIIEEPVENIVTQLKELHAIPDLTGVDVKWVGLGITCGDQARLTRSYKYKLQSIWKEFLLREVHLLLALILHQY